MSHGHPVNILLLDNYDSFTYNLLHLLRRAGGAGSTVEVARNDALELDDIRRMAPDAVVISPGPGRPAEAGICPAVVREFTGVCAVLGVCLGHQCIVDAFGGRVQRALRLVHGKATAVFHDGRGLFRGLASPLYAARYHSLAADAASLPAVLRVTARDDAGEIMALEHRQAPVWGVQFHPESFLTPAGETLLANFMTLAARPAALATPTPGES